jgi:hypothetical protein
MGVCCFLVEFFCFLWVVDLGEEIIMKKYLLPILLIAFWGCEEEEKIIVEDCAEVPGGDNICGCTNSAATNYNSSATYDDH